MPELIEKQDEINSKVNARLQEEETPEEKIDKMYMEAKEIVVTQTKEEMEKSKQQKFPYVLDGITPAEELYPQGYTVVESNNGGPDMIVPKNNLPTLEEYKAKQMEQQAKQIEVLHTETATGNVIIDSLYPHNKTGIQQIIADAQKVAQPVVKTRTTKAVTGGKLDPDELIGVLEEKISFLSSVKLLNWGGGTGESSTPKAIRELYIGIDKDVEAIKVKYIQLISAI
jgi:hypothetical protein